MQDSIQQFKALILGPASLAYYMGAEFFALLALILSLYSHSTTRDVNATTTPVKFSWAFLIMDNFKRIVVGQIALFLIFRFTTELMGHPLNMFLAVGIGFFLSYGLDKVIQWLKDKAGVTSLQQDRAAITTTAPPEPPAPKS
jgi:hypothetical protein